MGERLQKGLDALRSFRSRRLGPEPLRGSGLCINTSHLFLVTQGGVGAEGRIVFLKSNLHNVQIYMCVQGLIIFVSTNAVALSSRLCPSRTSATTLMMASVVTYLFRAESANEYLCRGRDVVVLRYQFGVLDQHTPVRHTALVQT